MKQHTSSPLPVAIAGPARRISWVWLVPTAATILAMWIGLSAWFSRGLQVSVQFGKGHGLETGADVRYNGTVVGQVDSIELAPDNRGIIVNAVLLSKARHLARGGSRFWIVRPQLGLTGITGLDTVVGPRYLKMVPGNGPAMHDFVGLGEPPIVESIEPGDLEVTLVAKRRGGLRPGASVLYRQVPIGTIVSVGLSSDGGAVEARVHIQKAYAQLIRTKTKFWSVGGFEAQLGLKGMSIEMESVESLLAGGVSIATPPHAGQVVNTGHRFALAQAADSSWLEWEPMVLIGSSYLPAGAAIPSPMRAVKNWREGTLITSNKSRRGWVLQVEQGLLGPSDLLAKSDDDSHEANIEVSGRRLSPSKVSWSESGVAMLNVVVSPTQWPNSAMRRAQSPEDCLAVADPTATPLPLFERRLEDVADGWHIDPVVPVDANWHGAAVLARTDGQLIGVLIVDEDHSRIALLPNRMWSDSGHNKDQ